MRKTRAVALIQTRSRHIKQPALLEPGSPSNKSMKLLWKINVDQRALFFFLVDAKRQFSSSPSLQAHTCIARRKRWNINNGTLDQTLLMESSKTHSYVGYMGMESVTALIFQHDVTIVMIESFSCFVYACSQDHIWWRGMFLWQRT